MCDSTGNLDLNTNFCTLQYTWCPIRNVKESSRTKRSKYTQEEYTAEKFKLRAKINQVETKRTIQRINKTRSWYFEKISKIDKHLAKLSRGHRDSIQINKIKYKGSITTETEETQKIIISHYKSLYSTTLENLDEMDRFLERYQAPNLNQDHISHVSCPITPKEIEAFIKSLQPKKQPSARCFKC